MFYELSQKSFLWNTCISFGKLT